MDQHGGVLQGTPLTDEHLFQELEFLVGNLDVAGKESITTTRGRQRFESFRVPEHLLVVNYIGIPLTGSISFFATEASSPCASTDPVTGFRYCLI